MTIETKTIESEKELFDLGFVASTAVECAYSLLNGHEVKDYRLEAGRKFVENEAMKAGTALIYIKDSYYPKDYWKQDRQ